MSRWYGRGLRFSCTQCGTCCTGAPGHVWITSEEEQRLALRLRVPVKEFRQRYARQVGERRSLVEMPNGDCVFLTKERRCSIHEDKPRQCVTFPFWERIVATKSSWDDAARTCPGMGEGALFSHEEIATLARPATPKEAALRIMGSK